MDSGGESTYASSQRLIPICPRRRRSFAEGPLFRAPRSADALESSSRPRGGGLTPTSLLVGLALHLRKTILSHTRLNRAVELGGNTLVGDRARAFPSRSTRQRRGWVRWFLPVRPVRSFWGGSSGRGHSYCLSVKSRTTGYQYRLGSGFNRLGSAENLT